MEKKDYNRIYAEKNKKKILEKAKEYRNRPEIIERRKKWRHDNKEYLREYQQKNKAQRKLYKITKNYGISADEYHQMMFRQKDKCAICLKEATHVDHNHKTGQVRGILCRSCNLILGYAYDTETILLAAIKYLKKNG